MDQACVNELLKRAVIALFENQPDIFKLTPDSGETEWNLAHHYASELNGRFPGLSCDIEISKRNFDNKRPDIIFHERGCHRNNFLVIEIKRDGQLSALEKDAQKIASYWFEEPLSYQFGAVVNLRNDRTGIVEVFQNRKKGSLVS